MANNKGRKTLTPRDVADIYGFNIGTLANMRFHKQGPRYIKAGRKVLYRIEDIESWLARNVVLTHNDKD